MLQLMPRFTLLAAVTLAACAFPVQAAETVTITSSLASKGPFTSKLLKPSGAGPFPVVVALHGCGGLLNSRGRLRSREADWAERFLAAGYAVLFPDSFTARGMREICTNGERSIFPKDRADDALAAGEWLSGQPFVDRRRLALIGWSHGAMAVLWALRPGFMGNPPLFKTAIAFYPGCRQIDRLEDWRPSVPLTLMIGSADDWTRPGPCRSLAKRTGFRFIEYDNAYHGFDAPNSRVRVREGLGRPKDGKAHVGTDQTARAASIKEVMAILREAFRTP
jgi:dienelactone hydrolase